MVGLILCFDLPSIVCYSKMALLKKSTKYVFGTSYNYNNVLGTVDNKDFYMKSQLCIYSSLSLLGTIILKYWINFPKHKAFKKMGNIS